jgi:hypothetical protein
MDLGVLRIVIPSKRVDVNAGEEPETHAAGKDFRV